MAMAVAGSINAGRLLLSVDGRRLLVRGGSSQEAHCCSQLSDQVTRIKLASGSKSIVHILPCEERPGDPDKGSARSPRVTHRIVDSTQWVGAVWWL